MPLKYLQSGSLEMCTSRCIFSELHEIHITKCLLKTLHYYGVLNISVLSIFKKTSWFLTYVASRFNLLLVLESQMRSSKGWRDSSMVKNVWSTITMPELGCQHTYNMPGVLATRESQGLPGFQPSWESNKSLAQGESLPQMTRQSGWQMKTPNAIFWHSPNICTFTKTK